jgi:phosphoglycerol transferase
LKKRCQSLAAYLLAVALCVALVAFLMRLWRADLAIPFHYSGDSLFIQMLVKGTLDNGWYLHNPYVGAPTGLDMQDFPCADGLTFVLIRVIGRFSSNYAMATNLFFLITFPLTTLTALFTLRRLGVSHGPAIVMSLLFTFLPYHFMRGLSHLFLASYFLIPLAILVILWVYLDRGLFCRWDEERLALRWKLGGGATIFSVVVCLLMGSAGVYYAFFTCYLLLMAGIACSLRVRKVYPLGIGAALAGCISLGVACNLAPTALYVREHGKNPMVAARDPQDSDTFGMKAVQLVLPIDRHRLSRFSQIKERYYHFMMKGFNENSYVTLGVVGSIGFLLLIGRLLGRHGASRPSVMEGLTVLNLCALLLACVGGGGSLFNVFVNPSIRAYNRMSIFIGFFALQAVALILDRLTLYLHSRWTRLLFHGFLAMVLVGGVLDQSTADFIPKYQALREAFTHDAAFFGRIEASLPPGARIFQLPSIPFPEGPSSYGMYDYDHFRGYLHSHHLYWSHGAMRGRAGDQWRRDMAQKHLPDLLQALAQAGFHGLFIDREGYADRAGWLEAELVRSLGAQPLVSPDGRQSFFVLVDGSPSEPSHAVSLAAPAP